MNEYTVNIPINEYDRLRLCELQLEKSYVLELVKKATILASFDIHGYNYGELIRAQNNLMTFINSNFFEFISTEELTKDK